MTGTRTRGSRGGEYPFSQNCLIGFAKCHRSYRGWRVRSLEPHWAVMPDYRLYNCGTPFVANMGTDSSPLLPFFFTLRCLPSVRWTMTQDMSIEELEKVIKIFDIRPHRRQTRSVQSYSPDCASVHPRLVHASLGSPVSTSQTACRSVQPLFARLTIVSDRQTNYATPSVAMGRIYVLRCGLKCFAECWPVNLWGRLGSNSCTLL